MLQLPVFDCMHMLAYHFILMLAYHFILMLAYHFILMYVLQFFYKVLSNSKPFSFPSP